MKVDGSQTVLIFNLIFFFEFHINIQKYVILDLTQTKIYDHRKYEHNISGVIKLNVFVNNFQLMTESLRSTPVIAYR